MNPTSSALNALAVALAYLIGSIPFGFLTALWVRGIDIRTVGSGNIGATNVGRVLGFRFFVLVFLLDLLKGLLPTLFLPFIVADLGGNVNPELRVLVALATILGHNFPIFLKLRGGKGVATSLGALLALDATASLAAVGAFVVFLTVTRFVSLSSLMGGLVFVAVHFAQIERPWDRDHSAMSLATLGLLGLLVARHRKNVARIAAGTEPRVSFRRRRANPPSGKAATWLVVALAVVAIGIGLAVQAGRRAELTAGPYRLTEVSRAATGHQRAERVAFADGGTLLAVTCPRYNRVVLYRVEPDRSLSLASELVLDGKPVAIAATPDLLFVLQRPSGDSVHLEPGWYETFDFRGARVGSKVRVGHYPDDLAVSPDGRSLLVLASGRGEGDPHRPAPALEAFEIPGGSEPPRVVGRLTFDRQGDDPLRLVLAPGGTLGAVTFEGKGQISWLDLSDRSRPRVASASDPSNPNRPLDSPDGPWIVPAPGADALVVEGDRDAPRLVVEADPDDSGLTLLAGEERQFPLLGRMNLSAQRPTGLAYDGGRGVLAVANRSGGVHLIAIERSPVAEASRGPLAASPDGPPRR